MRTRAFTLLELVIVVAMLGLMAGLIGARFAANTAIEREATVLRALTLAIASARVEAMRTSTQVCTELQVEGGALALTMPGQRHGYEAHGLRMVDRRCEPVSVMRACFDAAGRTTERVWRFISADADRSSVINAALLGEPWDRNDRIGRDVPGQVWRIVFDPISGVPRVERVDGVDGGAT